MLKVRLRKKREFVGSLMAATFVIALFFCLNTVNMVHDASASCCTPTSYSSAASSHRMDLGDHLQHWKQTFSATNPSPSHLLLALGIIFVSLGLRSSFLQAGTHKTWIHQLSPTTYRERNAIAKIFHPILQALSNGRLHPRLYNLSSIVA